MIYYKFTIFALAALQAKANEKAFNTLLASLATGGHTATGLATPRYQSHTQALLSGLRGQGVMKQMDNVMQNEAKGNLSC